MRLDLTPLDDAIAQLEEAIEYHGSDLASRDPALKLHLRAAAIQAFEFTYELTFKMVKRHLEQVSPNPAEILDGAIRGEKGQPSDRTLARLGENVLAGKAWDDVFEGVAVVEIRTEGIGPSLALRFSKKEGIPIQVVAEGTPGASVVGLKRVNELDYYNLGAKQLAGKLDLTMPKAIAVA